MQFSRRSLLSGGVASGLSLTLLSTKPANADNYPDRYIRLIVPWPAGGITDVTARIISQRLSIELGQSVVIDNRPGAAGTLGHGVASQAKPDGYTLLLGTNSSYAMSPHLLEKLPFDPEKSFIGIGLVARSAQMFCCHPSLPVKTMQEFLTYVRARQPDGVLYQSPGPGSSSHLAGELLMSLANFRMVHVPYRGGGPAMQAMLAGEVSVGFVDIIIGLPQVEAGGLRLLGVSTDERLPILPDVPTLAEAGVPGFQSSTDVALFAPAGTPDAIIRKLSTALIASLKSEDVSTALRKQGAIIIAGKPEEYPAYFRQEYEKWRNVVKARGITAK